MYYQELGIGPPLLLIHGGTGTSANWHPYMSTFARHFHVVAPDSRAHGRTNNPAGRLSYRAMADDIAALIQALGLEQPRVCGYSDGGQIALELGMRYPGLASALVVGGAWFKFSEPYLVGIRHFGFEEPGIVNTAQIEQAAPQLVEAWQKEHAGGPDYWKILLTQISTMWHTPLDYTPADFACITATTLVLIGDRDDFIPVEEAVEMYRLIPQAELAVVAGADHGLLFSRPEGFTQPVLEFLLRQRARTALVEAGSD
jgi:pimeloyl-ACP methyl ester carboxylesterase